MSISKNTVTQVISAVIVTAALAAGAMFGNLTSADNPANAETGTPTSTVEVVDATACTLCVATPHMGSGGNVPAKR
jgi:hypothetical protein